MDSSAPALAARSGAPVLARPLTPQETGHLDRLRDWLRTDGTDAHDAAALDARWARLLETHPSAAQAPSGVIAAIGIAVGDLLVGSVPDATWMMCPGPDGATPGVLLAERPNMPVLPVLDAHARWRVRSPQWVADYVQRATTHLRGARAQVPTPHRAPEAGAGAVAVPPAAASGPVAAPHVEPVDAAAPVVTVDVPAPVETVDAAAPVEPVDAPAPLETVDATPPVEPVPVAVPQLEPDPVTVPQPGTAPIEPAAFEPVPVEPETFEPVPLEPAATWTPTVVAHGPAPDPEPTWTPVFTPGVVDGTGATLTPSHVAEPAPAAPVTPGLGLPVTSERALTPEDLPHRPSERVQDIALRALELALDRAVADPAGCAPFVLVREGHDVEVLDFVHSDDGVAQARAAARDGGWSAAAVAWTSPADATRPHPRVVVDASAAGRPGIRVAHSFSHDADGGHEVGGPQVVGQSAPVL